MLSNALKRSHFIIHTVIVCIRSGQDLKRKKKNVDVMFRN